MIYGYARVSTLDQNNALQVAALTGINCDKIYQEKMSGIKHRPVLETMLKAVKSGDTVYVYKIDRLARSLSHFMRIFELLKSKGVTLMSIQETINPDTSQGRFFIQMLSVFAEFEHQTIRERCMAGQLAAKQRGQVFGRPRHLTDDDSLQVEKMWRSGWWSQRTLADVFEVNPCVISLSIYRIQKRGRYAL